MRQKKGRGKAYSRGHLLRFYEVPDLQGLARQEGVEATVSIRKRADALEPVRPRPSNVEIGGRGSEEGRRQTQ